jgi:hypothetical protein
MASWQRQSEAQRRERQRQTLPRLRSAGASASAERWPTSGARGGPRTAQAGEAGKAGMEGGGVGCIVGGGGGEKDG